ncbi:MAG: BMP family ABC transporter substrate-binding protein [Oscillospiraceae bacterium]|nr:BMP family ABC transporter substrate-binding protein [Oscillospiraceae bacterium]
MSRQEAFAQFLQANKLAQKYYKNALSRGAYPYLPVLEDLLRENQSAGRMNLGLVDIPTELIIGTNDGGRREAFAGNFMPLLGTNSEFGEKWITLCEAHLSDVGIRDPIRCYEYLGFFYVVEGNKRVSVFKSYNAPTVPGSVVRIIPAYSDDSTIRLYYEFLRFYPRCSLYQIRFTIPGSYEKLQERMGFEREHIWTIDEKRAFLALLNRFDALFRRMGGSELPVSACDALLVCLQVFSFQELKEQGPDELKKTLEAMWNDIKSSSSPSPISVSTDPEDKESGLLDKILGITRPSRLNVAVIYAYDPEVSLWSRSHLQGERELVRELGEKVSVKEYMALDQDYLKAMNEAVLDGAELMIATTPQMIDACRKIAALHPELRILNCSLSMPYTGIRTYYSRTYEAKFITGAIAGAMAPEDRIGYIANYPIVGVPAEINAFALGAQMTNPRVRIDLVWSSESKDPVQELRDRGISVISNRDATDPEHAHWALEWGTYRIRDDGSLLPLALPCWDWGRFYVQVVQSIFSGVWDALGKNQSTQAINYWWGMRSGVIDIQLSPALPEGIRRLVEHLCRDLRGGWFDPFLCTIRDQDGVVRSDGSDAFSAEELIRMDWLCENVDGHIPALDELKPEAVETAKILAIHPEKL